MYSYLEIHYLLNLKNVSSNTFVDRKSKFFFITSIMNDYVYQLLGVRVNLLSMPQLNCLIEQTINCDRQNIVANHNLNSLYIHHHNSMMQSFYSTADYVHVDGMALILLGKLLKLPFKRIHRVTYADWIWSLMAIAEENGWRVMYLGSKPGIAEKGASVLRKIHPNLQIATQHGYFSFESNDLENKKVIEKIKAYQPNILMVGMGMPRQEKWIYENRDRINANIILPCGACIDYIAGEIPTPPRWMGKVGLEWLYRLITEPKRLWKRYLIEPWFIFSIFLKEYFSILRNNLFTTTKNADRSQ